MHEEKKWIQFISELTPWATEMEKTRRGAGVEGKMGNFIWLSETKVPTGHPNGDIRTVA